MEDPQIQLGKRDRKSRRVPRAYTKLADLTPTGILLFWGNIPMYEEGAYGTLEMEFVPECPNPDPKRIPHAVWMSVDSMTCKRGFRGDYEWYREIIAGHEAVFEEIVSIGTAEVLKQLPLNATPNEGEEKKGKGSEKQLGRKRRTMATVTKALALPDFLNHLIYRRIILWIFSATGSLREASVYLGYAASRSEKKSALYERSRLLELHEEEMTTPLMAENVLPEEKKWIRKMMDEK